MCFSNFGVIILTYFPTWQCLNAFSGYRMLSALQNVPSLLCVKVSFYVLIRCFLVFFHVPVTFYCFHLFMWSNFLLYDSVGHRLQTLCGVLYTCWITQWLKNLGSVCLLLKPWKLRYQAIKLLGSDPVAHQGRTKLPKHLSIMLW